MNRLVCTNLDRPAPADLPPARREGPARVLFVHGLQLGFGTATRSIEDYAASHPGIDAVHLRLVMPRWLRIVAAGRGIPLAGYRAALGYRRLLRGLIGPVFPLERFDLVHIMTQQRALIAEGLARRGLKTVVNIDATAPAYDREFGLRRPFAGLETDLERRVFRAAAGVACWSHWAAGSVAGDFGTDPAKVFLYRPCVRVSPPSARRPGGREPGPVRILFAGNDWERKGGPRLVRWHQEHWRDAAELHICSASAPPDRSLRGIVWHGATPHDRLIGEVLPRMDLMVMPTTLDTLMIAAQEAQAYGLPVVTSRIAGLAELVQRGRTGFLCGPRDDAAFVESTGRLIADPALRATMSAAALEHGRRNLSWETWHRHLIDQLIAIADGRPPLRLPGGVESPA